MRPYGHRFTVYIGALRNGTIRQSNKYRRTTHVAQRAATRRAAKKAERREWRRAWENDDAS